MLAACLARSCRVRLDCPSSRFRRRAALLASEVQCESSVPNLVSLGKRLTSSEPTSLCAGPTCFALRRSPLPSPLFTGQRLRCVDMERSLQPSEYVDGLPLLERALAELSKGQLVRDERYGMMDLMSAIEARALRVDDRVNRSQLTN